MEEIGSGMEEVSNMVSSTYKIIVQILGISLFNYTGSVRTTTKYVFKIAQKVERWTALPSSHVRKIIFMS